MILRRRLESWRAVWLDSLANGKEEKDEHVVF